MNRTATSVMLVPVLLAGCTTASATSSGDRRPAVAPAPKVSSTPSMPAVPPMPADGFSGPGSFVIGWTNVTFAPAACAATHPLASCFAATAKAELPVAGSVALARTETVGDAPGPAATGCVTAETDGTMSSPTGRIAFHGSGSLCGKVSTFDITNSAGSGSLAGFQLQGQIVNDSSAETWTGLLTPVQ